MQLNNIKDFEVRLNDRNFKVGDTVKLVEIDNIRKVTGRTLTLMPITHILENCIGIKNNYIILLFNHDT